MVKLTLLTIVPPRLCAINIFGQLAVRVEQDFIVLTGEVVTYFDPSGA